MERVRRDEGRGNRVKLASTYWKGLWESGVLLFCVAGNLR